MLSFLSSVAKVWYNDTPLTYGSVKGLSLVRGSTLAETYGSRCSP